jgi:hypothetical protein
MSQSGPIEWAYTPRTSRLLRALVYVPFAALGGLFVLLLFLVGALAVDALLSGDIGQLALVVGFVLAGLFAAVRGPGALWLLPDERERLLNELDLPLSRRTLLGASAVGAVVLLVAVSVEFWVGTMIFLGGMAMLILVSALRSEGEIDAEELTLEYNGRDMVLTALRNVRAVTVGSLVFCWFSFERGGVSARSPRFVVLPAEAYRRARPVFERAIESPTESGRTAPLAERVIFLVFGIGLLALGPVFWVLTAANPGARLIVTYLGAMVGIFGLLFVWFAAVN